MSIKKKKARTSNTYRLKKIEDRLISMGYVCVSYIEGKKGIRRWVDCIEGGRDISYNANAGKVPDPDEFLVGPIGDNFFYIHAKQGASVSADTVGEAITKSRKKYF